MWPFTGTWWNSRQPANKKPVAKKARPLKRIPKEHKVRDILASSISSSRKEVPCSSGTIDVLTPDEIIEVKRAALWKAALGQVLAYSVDFPAKTPRVHLYGNDVEHFRLAATTCAKYGVRVTACKGDGMELPIHPVSLDTNRPENNAQISDRVLADDQSVAV